MIIEEKYIPIISDSLDSFTMQNEEYSIPYTLYSFNENHTFHSGFSLKDAQELKERLVNKDYNMPDSCINYVYNIVLTYKSIINFGILYGKETAETILTLKNDRKSINAFIRSLKAYCRQNNIELYVFDSIDNSDNLFSL